MATRIFAWLSHHKYRVLIGAAILTLATGKWVEESNHCLATHDAPNKIVSLELAWTNTRACAIVSAWNDDQKVQAIASVWRDFAFILGYSLTLLVFVLIIKEYINKEPIPDGADPNETKERRRWWNNIFFHCAWIAGLGDALENVFMLLFLNGASTPAFTYSFPATVKFIAIGGVVIYLLYYLIKSYNDFLLAVWLYSAGILSVLLGYFVFIKLTQGQDVLLQVGEYSGPFTFSLIAVAMWAGFSWYGARLLSYVKEYSSNSIRLEFHKHFPRIIAYNTYISIQAAILALPTICNWPANSIWGFVIVHNACYFVASGYFTKEKPKPLLKFLFGVVCLLSVVYISYLLYKTLAATGEPWISLPLFAIILFIMQLIQFWYLISRRKKIDKNAQEKQDKTKDRNLREEKGYIRILNLKLLAMREKFAEQEQQPYKIFLCFAIAGVVLYVSAMFCLWLADHMGPLAIVLLSFGILGSLANAITTRSIRYKVSLGFLLLVLAILIGFLSDPYHVRLQPNPRDSSYAKRPSLKVYFDNWIKVRESKIRNAKEKFPVYLVIADGGASRSGYWVASVLSAMQDASIRDTIKADYFSDHLLCLAGASGGSVGTSTFYALLKNKTTKNDTVSSDYLARSRCFLKQDFLSPAITHLLGADLFRHFLPLIEMDDRAAALEVGMERFSSAPHALHGAFKKPLHKVLDYSGQLPILFINTTNVQQGSPAVVSSVHLESFSKRMDVLDLLDAIDHGKDMNLSTAVVMGARFPYVSPAGKLGKQYFVDGGYFDNTGSGIVHEMLQYLDSLTYSDKRTNFARDTEHQAGTLYNKLQFHLLHISNTPLDSCTKETSIHPVVNDLAAPLLTLFSTYSAQTDINDNRLVTYLRRIENVSTNDSVRTIINLYDSATPDLPMNWVISDYSLNEMDKRLDRAKHDGLLTVHTRWKKKCKDANCDCNKTFGPASSPTGNTNNHIE